MRNLLIAGILLLSFLTRVLLIENYPVGFTPDEASFGYDAYSLLKTGKDQWGHFLPLFLESFGDFKAPVYSYLTIPSVVVFGLSKFATRLPNALVGTASVLVTYLLVKELFAHKFDKKTTTSDKRQVSIGNNHLSFSIYHLALSASILQAISPWHIMLSRGAFEANLTTFFLPLGILLFLKGLGKPKYLIWSTFIFGINLFTYHSAKVVTPLVVIILIVIAKDGLLKLGRKLFLPLIIFLVFGFLTLYTFTQGAGRRAADVGIFNGALEAQADVRLKAINNGLNPNLARLIYNKYFVVLNRFYYNYKQYFTPRFLFTDGAGETTYGMLPGIGVLYRFELFTLTLFLIYLWKHRENKFLWFIFIWILLAPVPAGLTMGVGYAGNRASGMMPALQIASAIGLYYFWSIVNLKPSLKIKVLSTFGVLIVLSYSLISFLKIYFFDSHAVAAGGMLYGNLEVAYWLRDNAEDRLKIIVSRKLSEPQIYIAFANKYDPESYQINTSDWERYKDEKLIFLDQLHAYYLGNYVFKRIETADLHENKLSLLVGRPDEFPDGVNIVKKFTNPDGTSAIYVVEPYGELYATKTF